MLSQNTAQFGIILQNKIKKQITKQLNSTVKLITLPHGEGAQLSCSGMYACRHNQGTDIYRQMDAV